MEISCHNINRLESKFEEIKYNLLYSEKKPFIIGFCETFLKQNTNDKELQIPGYNMVRKDREGADGGGWVIYFSDNLPFVQRKTWK